VVPVVPVVPPSLLFPPPLDDSAAAPAITAAPMPRAVPVVRLPTRGVFRLKGAFAAGFAGVPGAEDPVEGSAAKTEALKESIRAEASSLVMVDSFLMHRRYWR